MTVMFLSLWGYVDRCEEDVSRFRVACAEKQGGTGFLQPFADSPLDNEDVGATMLQSVISSAQERMWIMTPYLILDDKMATALCVAAKTGVDVRIITPAIPDKWYVHAVTRANYEELTRAGVGSLAGVFEAPVSELVKVPGIGPGAAELIALGAAD